MNNAPTAKVNDLSDNGFVWGCQREGDPGDGLRHRASPTIPLDTMV
jgi:hypothetical protein